MSLVYDSIQSHWGGLQLLLMDDPASMHASWHLCQVQISKDHWERSNSNDGVQCSGTHCHICTTARVISTNIISVAFLVMGIITFPIAGIVADAYVGRLKVIQAGIASLTVSFLFNILLILLQDYLPAKVETCFVCCVQQNYFAMGQVAMWLVFFP